MILVQTCPEFVFLVAMQAEQFDYIIIGAGAAGLMLATALGNDPHFKDKSIALLERQDQRKNDRTWSFWEKGKGEYDEILLKKWDTIRFKDGKNTLDRDMAPYAYKTLRALDFYTYQQTKLEAFPNVSRRLGTVTHIKEDSTGVTVYSEGKALRGGHVFSSVHFEDHMNDQSRYPVLQQHFLGWYIKSDTALFDPGIATFMDFSIPQRGNTRFMYVLPITAHSGLVEYTLFSKELLPEAEYESAIAQYIADDLNCKSYTITEKERGSIPMTAYDFSVLNSARITYIGTAGGWTKPSTGFTFRNILKNTRKLLENLKSKTRPIGIKQPSRHRFYDTLLLDILDVANEKGSDIFAAMFRKRSVRSILSFLDEETSFFQEIRMIWACPKKPFLNALWNRLF